MEIFNHVSKNKSRTNIQSGTASFDVIFSDYMRKDDLNNYYKKSEPLVVTNTIDMGGNKIISLKDPMVATDAINSSFIHKELMLPLEMYRLI